MKNFLKITILICVFCLNTEANARKFVQPKNVESLTVLATSSLTVPISDLTRQYSLENRVDLNSVFDSSSELFAKIDDGDPADVVIVSDPKWLDKLDEMGLIEGKSRVKIASNRLALVASKKFDLKIASSQLEEMLDYIRNRTLMVIADPAVETLGERSVEMLENIKKWERFKKFAVLAPTSAKTVDLIVKSETAGIVYSSDAKLFEDDLFYIGDIPTKLYKPIEYYAAVVLGNNMEGGEKFLQYLSGENAKEVLKNTGFVLEWLFILSCN